MNTITIIVVIGNSSASSLISSEDALSFSLHKKEKENFWKNSESIFILTERANTLNEWSSSFQYVKMLNSIVYVTQQKYAIQAYDG